MHIHQTRRNNAAFRIDELHVVFKLDVGRNIKNDALFGNQHIGLSDIPGADCDHTSPNKTTARRGGLLEQIVHRETSLSEWS